MRPGPAALALIIAFGALGLAAGCSRHDTNGGDVGQDLKNTGHDISHEASKVAHDPEVKSAASDLKAAGHDVAQDLRHAGSQAKSAAQDAAHDTRNAAHNVTHDNGHDTKRNDNS
jgi:hypothetical protein